MEYKIIGVRDRLCSQFNWGTGQAAGIGAKISVPASSSPSSFSSDHSIFDSSKVSRFRQEKDSSRLSRLRTRDSKDKKNGNPFIPYMDTYGEHASRFSFPESIFHGQLMPGGESGGWLHINSRSNSISIA